VEDAIKMNPKQTGCKDVDWIHLAQDRDQWRALVNTVMNLRVPLMLGISLLAKRLSAPQKGICCTGLNSYDDFVQNFFEQKLIWGYAIVITLILLVI
jgi:hypothetical protein